MCTIYLITVTVLLWINSILIDAFGLPPHITGNVVDFTNLIGLLQRQCTASCNVTVLLLANVKFTPFARGSTFFHTFTILLFHAFLLICYINSTGNKVIKRAVKTLNSI